MIERSRRTTIVLLIASALILACVPTFALAVTPIPTFDPNSIGTSIVETANAAATQTQLFTTPTLTPTFTSTPTKTPSETPTPTKTFIFLFYTPTKTATLSATEKADIKDYACELITQTPEDNNTIGGGGFFSVRWQVKNTGKRIWDSNAIDYRYKSGTKMHQQPVYDLYRNIAVGDVADVIVDMTAPTTPGKYSTAWVIRAGKTEFCKLTLTIEVK
ncbi:MAG: NBR1-Ig-like domain-containing protein [Anaerolineales bacterium]|nr:NBR1-Ig-like domain-containing protein [Anaerolineales bacterium]